MGEYEREEQPNTQFDLGEKIKMYGNTDVTKSHDILVEFDCDDLNNENFQVLVNLSKMLQDSGEVGEMEFDIFKLYINSLQTYEKELIICES
jgi:agmatine/peptidylarginine deiminase